MLKSVLILLLKCFFTVIEAISYLLALFKNNGMKPFQLMLFSVERKITFEYFSKHFITVNLSSNMCGNILNMFKRNYVS